MRRINRAQLLLELPATRARTRELFSCLEPAHFNVPRIQTMNPPLWELGHVGWFQENWCLRQHPNGTRAGSLMQQGDFFYDSSAIANFVRWDLPLPNLKGTEAYLQQVLDLTLERLSRAADEPEALYFYWLVLMHEKMHIEAFSYTWQVLGYPATHLFEPPTAKPARVELSLAGGVHELGSKPNQGFVFDNEKWAHETTVSPFSIDSAPVTNQAFLAFVEDGGYQRSEFWDAQYFSQLQTQRRELPISWRRTELSSKAEMRQRWFNQWVPLNPALAVSQVSDFEAKAYCRWAKRRLPTELQWEYAATQHSGFAWGQSVWEWTATDFSPFQGFSPDPYHDYSAPWFYNHRVLRGGSFVTPQGVSDVKFRNFFMPQRNDLFAGFRTCA